MGDRETCEGKTNKTTTAKNTSGKNHALPNPPPRVPKYFGVFCRDPKAFSWGNKLPAASERLQVAPKTLWEETWWPKKTKRTQVPVVYCPLSLRGACTQYDVGKGTKR